MSGNFNENKILSVAEIKELWSKTYSSEGKPDWSHIFPYYHENIVFKDSIQRIEGIEKFQAMCKRLSKRCKSLEMHIYHIIKTDNLVMMDWKMTMSFRIFPKKPIFGATRLTFDDSGKIIEQRDYYDLWGDIYDGIPIFRRVYRWFMRVFFG
ncbi:MAG: limonene-1,2-epoxide hydrolase [Tenericutes bacterium HGW-Tenericutes-5]|nr:MAG: limonene-1,2-epoxide hydrolase [Tenericutes bacterium HGW-Tenericutes-5]